MKKKIIYGMMAIALISLVSAGSMYVGEKYTPYKFLETVDLSVLDNAIIAGNLRVDGLTDLKQVSIENTCPFSQWAVLHVDENNNVIPVCVAS